MKYSISILIALICTTIVYGQKNKITFVKKVPIKMKSTDTYSFLLGYDVEKDADLTIDFSGGPEKFWAGKTVQVSKGKGIVEVKVNPNKVPKQGKGYRVLASVRDRGGDWKTTKVSSIINNIEITKKTVPVIDDASFASDTPYSMPSKGSYAFNIEYEASIERQIVVAMYNKGNWLGASKKSTVQKGKGIQKVQVKLDPPIVGNKYKFVLFYGSGEGFPDTNIVSKEIDGIEITEAQKNITIADIRERSILLSLNKSSKIVTLPGATSYDLIQIIAQNGKVIKEKQNSNTIEVSDLPNGGYFMITSRNDYYQFIKL